jgi:hypothetical protein
VPVFQLPLADNSASATCSVDPHETPAVASTSLQAKLKAMASWTNTVNTTPEVQPEYPTTSAWPAIRTRAIQTVVPAASAQQ